MLANSFSVKSDIISSKAGSKMTISIIVAAAKNGVIGKAGDLPWYLPAELARFKEITMGHPIIMGRRTHESIGRTLPGRLNIVISRNKDYKPAQGSVLVHSLDDALTVAESADEVFIIGGESVFEEALPKTDKIYLTKVEADIPGDRFFKIDLSKDWRQTFSEKHAKDENNQYSFEFTVFTRKALLV